MPKQQPKTKPPRGKKQPSQKGKTPCGLCLLEFDAFLRKWSVSPTEGVIAELRDLVKEQEKTGGLRIPKFLDFFQQWHLPAAHPFWQKVIELVEAREAVGKPSADASGPRPPQQEEWKGDEIMRAKFAPLLWTVPEWLQEGLNIIAGRPKKGKSLLTLQIAQAICAGGRFAEGKEACPQGLVLYISLEAGPRRLQDRMQKQGWPHGRDSYSSSLTVRPLPGDESDLQKKIDRLLTLIAEQPYRMVIVDTMTRLAGKNLDQMSQGECADFLSPFANYAEAHRMSAVFIDHFRKEGDKHENPDDPVEDLLGSTQKAAVANSILGLYRKGDSPLARFVTTGHDQASLTRGMAFDPQALLWKPSGLLAVRVEGTDEKILNVMAHHGGPMTSSELTAVVVEKSANYISQRLRLLRRGGQVVPVSKQGRALSYDLPGRAPRLEDRTNITKKEAKR